METVKLIDILNSRNTSDDRITSWLFNKAQEVMDKASKHLEYVMRVMPEYDKHDASHSEKVLENIELLLGESSEELSSFELFFIILSAYLHDCAMALSDYEKAVLELTEGTEDKFTNESSIKNDGKKCLSATESKQFIKDHKASIYKDFKGDIQGWMFVPRTEDELIDYFSELLRDYQAFRNGYYEEIKDCKAEDFEKKNKSLRTEYIRQTHHTRIASYLEHSGDTIFKDFPIPGTGRKIAKDIAALCKAHGEEPKFLDTLKTKVKYCGNETANLQYIAMLLRIGDIVHYDYNRAPAELRSLHQFESGYSHWIWRIKANNGINYDISAGLISYNGFFCAPEDYYEFSNYLDWVDRELLLFLRMKSAWEKKLRVVINVSKNVNFFLSPV